MIFRLPLLQKGVVEKEIPQGVQTDLFGNIVEPAAQKEDQKQ